MRRRAPAARDSNAVCSPIRHLADLTNWKTPIDQPWFQPRSASPNAAVDFPLPSPVWMINNGRLRRCRVVSPSSGTCSGWPSGIRPPCLPDRGEEPIRRDLADRDVFGAEMRAEPGGEPEGEPAGLAVDHQRGDAGPPQMIGNQPRPVHRIRAVGGAAVGHQHQQRPAAGVADPFQPEGLRGAEQAFGQRRAATARQVGEPAGGDVDRRGRRQGERRAGARGR